MPLPKIATPTYELVLPSTGKTIKYRPFLVKEEKILILALESEDPKQITNAIKTTLKSCISTRGIKVEDLPTFDRPQKTNSGKLSSGKFLGSKTSLRNFRFSFMTFGLYFPLLVFLVKYTVVQ